MEIAILALGCFWGPEEKFSKLNGVINTEVGYCGGKTNSTTYEEVCSGSTNHAEVVKIEFDEKIISYEKILDLFFKMHDPTQKNMQYPDVGPQYRSEVFYVDEKQKNIASAVKDKFNKTLGGKVVTNINPLTTYIAAEDYHQKYIMKNRR